ncbi:primosomal protein DnaI [Heyndrickxia shackletonii]|uniref:Primosomal protein DnaI n=1 Tax=Heyndrickxia shackletonii TaxID=157838 RepID=A0A0Q3WW82_9BACI|nr:primosomal protein DnaI [Heyndrickxia shackletonii]KQL53330.1 primosomal protein DnaI [Heyndrickxia shackletonii]NEZ01602.1 primosomal protein DnaI [Heyndrickxia shackletonii]
MENINETLRRLSNNSNFQRTYSEMKQEILNHPAVREFLLQHTGEITTSMVEKSLMKLYEFISQTRDCQKCSSLESCVNMMQGYEPELVLGRNGIDIKYRPCLKKRMFDERKKNEKLIQSLYVPKDILHASFGEFSLESAGRLNAYEFAERFVVEYEAGKKMKGLFLYGSFGVGKSYLLGAIANHLAENKQVSSLLVYVPEFFREMKQSLGDHTLNEKLEMVKKAPVLMLDDIGAEAMTSWTRDEILGSILQFRMQENLPTFFTSNFDYSGLEHHLTYSQRGEEEKMKAARIMERIKYLSTPILVEGPNLRI